MIRVLVADDSATVRLVLSQVIDSDPQMHVVGFAKDGLDVIEMVRQLEPDLVTMDVNMPKLSGLAATETIMAQSPRPIVIVTSAPVGAGEPLTFEALDRGAVEVLQKPDRQVFEEDPLAKEAFLRTLRLMAGVKVVRRKSRLPAQTTPPPRPRAAVLRPSEPPRPIGDLPQEPPPSQAQLIAIGASAGGPPTLADVLARLKPTSPPIVIVQHMTPGFIPRLAEWLDSRLRVSVLLAEVGTTPRLGHVYLAPDRQHLVVRSNHSLGFLPRGADDVHCPGIDQLFRSVAETYGNKAVGVQLTGMGRDGARGLLAMRASGAWTCAQDEKSALVFSMPMAAIELGAASCVSSDRTIARELESIAGVPDSRS